MVRCARTSNAGGPSRLVALVGLDGRRGAERVGEVPRQNEIGGRIPRGQLS